MFAGAARRRLDRLHLAHRLAQRRRRAVLRRHEAGRVRPLQREVHPAAAEAEADGARRDALASRGGYTLYEVPTSGYLEVVDTTAPVAADRDNMYDDGDARTSSRARSPSTAIRSWRSTGARRRRRRSRRRRPTPVHRERRVVGRAVRRRSLHRTRAHGATGVGDAEGVVLAALDRDGRRQAGADRDARAELRRCPGPGGNARGAASSTSPRSSYPLLFVVGALTLLALIVIPRLGRRRSYEHARKTHQRLDHARFVSARLRPASSTSLP